jgi:GT2 family glycosyltransferase
MSEITVILNGFKRPQFLKEQVEAIKNQTIKPKEIMLWQNNSEGFDKDLTDTLTTSTCNKNLGVWARFAYALNAKTEYICIFDDDTIPGDMWFENCLETMKTHEGLLGTVGLIYDTPHSYRPNTRYGWADINNSETMMVDIVGHSWFFERDWLHYLWECCPDYNSMFLSGEDIGFSYILQKYGINTYVPPHPADNTNLWGSDHTKAMLYGTENVAISLQPGGMDKFNNALNYYMNKGFVTMNNR